MTFKEGEGWVCSDHLPPPKTCRHGRELCDDCAVENAVLEERERCAMIAEEYAATKYAKPNEVALWMRGQREAALRIALEIRVRGVE